MAYDFRQIHAKSVDDLEGPHPAAPFASPLIERIARARRVPLGQLSTETLRLLVSQRQALSYTLPVTLARLEEDPFAEGDMYRGDLLMAFLQCEAVWPNESGFLSRARALITSALQALEDLRPVDWAGGEIPALDALTEVDRDNLAPAMRDALTRIGQ